MCVWLTLATEVSAVPTGEALGEEVRSVHRAMVPACPPHACFMPFMLQLELLFEFPSLSPPVQNLQQT